MPLLFNTLLAQVSIEPADVRLLRHQDSRSAKGRTPYELWRDDRPAFNRYQETQSFGNRTRLSGNLWASFVVDSQGETLLAGLYRCRYAGVNDVEIAWANAPRSNPVGTCDVYELTFDERLGDLVGRLVIEWGDGERSWIQRADNQNKPVLEIRRVFREPDFPGFVRFIVPLSKVRDCRFPGLPRFDPAAEYICSPARKRKNNISDQQRAWMVFMVVGLSIFRTVTAATLR